jgi:hypothetical protein
MLAYDYNLERPQEPDPPQRLGLPRRREAPALGRNDLLAAFFCHPSNFDKGLQIEKNSFLMEQCGNVIENKAPLLKTWQ